MRTLHIVYITPSYPNGHSWEGLWAGYLEANRSHVDGDVAEYYNLFYDDPAEAAMAAHTADIVAITATSPQYASAMAMKGEVSSLWFSHQAQVLEEMTRPRFVIGGPHASAVPDDVKKDNWDCVIVGEGERQFDRFATAIRMGRTYRGGKPAIPMDIDKLRFPDRSLIKQERHIEQAYKDEGRRVVSILSGRGCPFRCDFCISHVIWGRHVRLRAAPKVLAEMEMVKRDWNPDFIKFSDDTFTINSQRNAELFKWMEMAGWNTPWGCNVHIDTIDDKKLKAMWDAGCTEIWVGVESGSPNVRRAMGKTNVSNSRIIGMFRYAKSLGMKTRAYFLIGHPTATIKDLLMTQDMADRLQADIVGFTILAPYPGSAHYDPILHKDVDWSRVDEYGNDFWKTEHFTNYQLKQHQIGLTKRHAGNLAYKHKVCGFGME